MTTQELIRAIAYFTALERYEDAERAAALLPDFIELIDVVRAIDGVEQLARALNAHRHRPAA